MFAAVGQRSGAGNQKMKDEKLLTSNFIHIALVQEWTPFITFNRSERA